MKTKRKEGQGWLTRCAVCSLLAFALALGVIVSLPVLDGAAQALDFDKSCSLRISAGSEELTEELKKASVTADVYRIADAQAASGSDTYTFDFLPDYKGLDIAGVEDSSKWGALAQEAAETAIKKGTADAQVSVGESVTGLSCGLYLIIPRGSGSSDYVGHASGEAGTENLTTTANSNDYNYQFTPSLVSLPAREPGTEDAAGDWVYDLTVDLKFERDNRNGSLEIVKTLTTYVTGEPATFIFSVEGTLEGRNVYSDVVAITFTSAGEQRKVVDNIPIGAEVTVTEVYSGTVYQLVSDASQTVVIEAGQTASAAFTNDYIDKPDEPEEPDEPTEPGPEEPDVPGPDEPNEPNEPGPEEPNEPNEPNEPGPDEPNEPEEPTEPEPNEPTEPADTINRSGGTIINHFEYETESGWNWTKITAEE